MRWRRGTLLVAALVLVAGCATEPSEASPPRGAMVAPVGLPDGPAGEHARWVLTTALGNVDRLDGEDLADRFSEALLDEDAAALRQTLDRVRSMGQWQVLDAGSNHDGRTAELVLRSTDDRHLLLHTTVDEDGRAIVFWFGHALDRTLDPARDTDRERLLAELPADSAVGVGTVADDQCVDLTIDGTAPDDRLPLASVAKLIVVDVVLRAVESGTLYWDAELVLDEQSRSLPAGRLATAATGSTLTIADAVRAVLTESDNTAADLLVAAVGHQAVEAAYAELAQTGPPAPFWTTREVFSLGWGPAAVPGNVLETIPDLEALRAAVAAGPLKTSVLDVVTPRWQDGLDWFLTPAQTCELGARLHARWHLLPADVRQAAGTDGTLLRKPGGIPGVATGLWLVEGTTGSTVITLQVASDQHTAVGDVAGLMAIGDALTRRASQ